jgi:4-hydroxy-tetrahydrodipicolinate synthase
MITPFTEDRALDLETLGPLVAWYLDRGVDGLFAVCQSSEMFELTLAERVRLAEAVVKWVDGRVGVIASGHISDDPDDQVEEVTRIASTGVDAVVLVTNRFASAEESDAVWQERLAHFLDRIPDSIPLGFYECPQPYKRVLSPQMMKWVAETGRFIFLKDTCCDLNLIEAKLDVAGDVKLYNANAATLLGSLQAGAAGYSSVMGNVHPQLYGWLCRHWADEPERAARLQDFLGVSSWMGRCEYPTSAKYYLQLEGVPITLHGRVRSADALGSSNKLEVEQLHRLTQWYDDEYKV